MNARFYSPDLVPPTGLGSQKTKGRRETTFPLIFIALYSVRASPIRELRPENRGVLLKETSTPSQGSVAFQHF